MDTFDVLGVPARRRILELLGGGERSSGELVTAIHNEFGRLFNEQIYKRELACRMD